MASDRMGTPLSNVERAFLRKKLAEHRMKTADPNSLGREDRADPSADEYATYEESDVTDTTNRWEKDERSETGHPTKGVWSSERKLAMEKISAREQQFLEKKAKVALKLARVILPNGNDEAHENQAVDLMHLPTASLVESLKRKQASLAAEAQDEKKDKKDEKKDKKDEKKDRELQAAEELLDESLLLEDALEVSDDIEETKEEAPTEESSDDEETKEEAPTEETKEEAPTEETKEASVSDSDDDLQKLFAAAAEEDEQVESTKEASARPAVKKLVRVKRASETVDSEMSMLEKMLMEEAPPDVSQTFRR